MTAPAFAYHLPWAYPGHGDHWTYHPVHDYPGTAPLGLIHVGVTTPVPVPEVTPTTLQLVNQAPPRMCFALGSPVDRYEDEDFCETFHHAIELAREGDRAAARRLLKDADRRAPMDAKVCRGFIELTWTRGRAENEFRTAISNAERYVRPGFTGVLPWSERGNRPFLVALRCLAWCRWRAGDTPAARRLLDSLLWLDPSDAQDVVPWIRLLDDRVDPESATFPQLDHHCWCEPPPRPQRWDTEEPDEGGWGPVEAESLG